MVSSGLTEAPCRAARYRRGGVIAAREGHVSGLEIQSNEARMPVQQGC
jgi:hypothetical protein